MVEKIKKWGMVILGLLGVVALFTLLRRNKDVSELEVSITDELKKEQELLEELRKIDTKEYSKEEMLEWLNKK